MSNIPDLNSTQRNDLIHNNYRYDDTPKRSRDTIVGDYHRTNIERNQRHNEVYSENNNDDDYRQRLSKERIAKTVRTGTVQEIQSYGRDKEFQYNQSKTTTSTVITGPTFNRLKDVSRPLGNLDPKTLKVKGKLDENGDPISQGFIFNEDENNNDSNASHLATMDFNKSKGARNKHMNQIHLQE